MFRSFDYSFPPIPLPSFTDVDMSNNELIKDLKEYVDACYSGMKWGCCYMSESAALYYKDVLLTDVLMEIDADKQLPASVYSMLYSVATASADDISALRAWEVLIALLTRHSGERASFLSCIPKPEELCNAWDKFGRHRLLS